MDNRQMVKLIGHNILQCGGCLRKISNHRLSEQTQLLAETTLSECN